MEIKLSTFDRELIRSYMEGSRALSAGIAYYKHVNASLSEALAKEQAIRYAQDTCQRLWQNDSTGYISNEYLAFREFQERVDKEFEFSIRKYDNYLNSQKPILERIKSWIKQHPVKFSIMFLCELMGIIIAICYYYLYFQK